MTSSEDNEGWFESDPFQYTKLHQAGYAVGGYDYEGKHRYVLYRVETNQQFTKVHDFDSLQDLQLMAKLLIDGGM